MRSLASASTSFAAARVALRIAFLLHLLRQKTQLLVNEFVAGQNHLNELLSHQFTSRVAIITNSSFRFVRVDERSKG